ncbi:MAG TPA: hypothetical protein EYN67_02760 [Flavobacteriales bacterium]|nr:hypothetical protein [Flavobacteriales bacterium]
MIESKAAFIKYLVGMTFCVLVLIVSCKKDKDVVEGCADSDAINYNPESTTGYTNCMYNSIGSFWYTKSTVDTMLIRDSITRLDFIIDGDSVNSVIQGGSGFNFSSDYYFNTTPSCVYASMSFSKVITAETQSFTYLIRDQNGNTVFSGTGGLGKVNCNLVKLEY